MTRRNSFLCACWIALPVAGLGQEPAPPPSPPASPPPAAVKAGSSGFSLADADGDFELRLRALIQADGRFYAGDEAPSTDGFLVRRARIELTGTVFESFDFRLMPDLAGSETTLLDAWLRWKISPALQVQVGKVRLPIGLERTQSREHNLFNELGYPTALVPNRDIGINLQGDLGGGALSYFVGVFDGAADSAQVVADADDHRELAARLFTTPLAGLGVGLAATHGTREGSAPSSYRTVGQQTFYRWRDGVADDGTTWRAVPQLYFHRGPFFALAEYARVSHEVRLEGTTQEIEASAWTASASWVFTGEEATFRGVTPKDPFDGGAGGRGAWQIVARATGLAVADEAFPRFADPSRAAENATTYGVGVNWYANRVVRWSADYHHTELDGGSLEEEKVLIVRAQVRF